MAPPQLSPEEEEQECSRAFQLSCAAVLPMVLKTAIELGLLEMLVQAGPTASLSSEELAARLPTTNPSAADMVERILRLLAANDVVRCPADGGCRKYSAAPICKYLVQNDDGGTVANIVLLHQDQVMIDTWRFRSANFTKRYLTDSILNGGHPVMAAHGMTTFEYQGGDRRFNKVFNDAMKGVSTLVMNNILRRYDGFADVQVLVDVGGNTGSNLRLITSFYPQVHGINFDLPHVVADAPALTRVEHRGGDMFEAVPAGDAIMLKWILHDWSDEHCVKILKNCWKALPAEKGRVVVVEYVLPAVPEATPEAKSIFQLDLCMAAYNVGGKERTEEEFRALAKEAGFHGFNALPVFAGTWLLEFIK
ncbi:caffeic acid 3-O-methyltransferase-like isoform X1 [Zingiber officinale]|uniref:caffeic acid 3-O-methyltransferase-like isoform X1 n=1 Tax=Zingiber officinale TaxID=94328 RepID=UPI001C4D8D72|nr:caffeic acid 3-O-methyltransferase-like isoform X1 [Zingiber officinale]